MRKGFLAPSAFALVCLFTADPRAAASFVHHEQTNDYVATPADDPGGGCGGTGTDTSCGRYVENADQSGSAGFQVYAPEAYGLRFKVEFQSSTTEWRVYYTTDGTNPSGSFGTPQGTTKVVTATLGCAYSDVNSSCQVVDVVAASIPPQPAGTTVRYIVSAWHSDGGVEIFANSGACEGCVPADSSSEATVFSYDVVAFPATPLVISEFRLRGPGADGVVPSADDDDDEFVEIHNNSDSDVTVNAYDGSGGFALAASDGVVRFVIPAGTTIPARGHFLGVNSAGYSLGAYPAGLTGAKGDVSFTTQIADNAGIALFRTANPFNFGPDTRLDAVGSTSELNTGYKEGEGYPAVEPLNINHTFFRDMCGKGGSTTGGGACPTGGALADTGDNARDFLFADPSGTNAGAGGRLGAPGPQNSKSPVQRNAQFPFGLAFPCVGSSVSPNREYNPTPGPASTSTLGTLTVRRRVTNNTGRMVKRLRFRVIDISTHPSPQGAADLRVLSSTATAVANPCTSLPTLVNGTTLETPPPQPNGGGFNTSLSADTVTLLTPLLPGASYDFQVVLGVQRIGSYKIYVNVEALP